MEKDLLRGFPISEEENEKIKKWYDFHKMENPQREHEGLEYRFKPTAIGTFGTVILFMWSAIFVPGSEVAKRYTNCTKIETIIYENALNNCA